ncbi:hypothetical protein AWC29_25805 [Mycobacterium triplex]|uniref:DUF305 domain-containing protein n=2 Tax=Mycobacterium triplex TaxID=47839 RepID=A0ABX3VWS1_9MYCO|nr:DUF305 domain-containing protein [Mycobacterium triplex]ORW99788.1 hypothetical protein AWC29_25805 [Mycobacterium triplex]
MTDIAFDQSGAHRRRRRESRHREVHYADEVPSLTIRVAAALTAWCVALLLSSCSGSPSGDHAQPTRSDDKPVITGEPAAFGPADVAFANDAIAHEQQGISMAQLVSDHSNNPDVVAFAAKTSTALQVDTQVLKALRAQWKESQDNPTGASGQPAAPSEPSSNATLAGLAAVRGAEFDTLWLNSMISLYQATIDLANREVANGKNVDATSLAKQIVEARQADIGQMRQLLAA